MEFTITLPDFLDPKNFAYALLFVAAAHALYVFRRMGRKDATISTHFSPKGGCTGAIVAELASARREILVQAYSFSCPDIANALIAASSRRVKVIVLLDHSNELETYSELGELEQHGLEVWIDAQHAIAHNKIMIIDGRTVITGSFNFTRQAEHSNAENLLIIRDHRDLAELYRTNFHSHRGHCQAPGKGPKDDSRIRADQGHKGGTSSGTHLHDHAHRAA
jgi:phosphatidylserine/phosphatidylglycerophosphate/cardiolipin synthase-like enzyme